MNQIKENNTYKQNLSYFKKAHPHIFKKIELDHSQKSFQLVQNKDKKQNYFNLKSLEADIYAYQSDPKIQAKNLSINALQNDPWLIINNENKTDITNIDKIIFVSSGLGYHLPAYDNTYNIKSMLIIEENIEIFIHSCYVINYQKLSKNKELFIHIGNDPVELKHYVLLFYNSLFFYNKSFKVKELFQNNTTLQVAQILNDNLADYTPKIVYNYDTPLKETKLNLSNFGTVYNKTLDEKLNSTSLNHKDLITVIQLIDYIRNLELNYTEERELNNFIYILLLRLSINFEKEKFYDLLKFALGYLLSAAFLGHLSHTQYTLIYNCIFTSTFDENNVKVQFLQLFINFLKSNNAQNKEIEFYTYRLNNLTNVQLDKSPKGYIELEFDKFANNFENQLINNLNYNAFHLLATSINKYLPKNESLSLLDLGCGTGLLVESLNTKLFNTCIGIDLSSNMLKVAKEKNIYTELVHVDIIDFMQNTNNRFDLIGASDTFIYIGNLEEVFKLAYTILSENGIFAFSIELNNNIPEYHLNDTGRFSHNENYIEKLSDRNSFKVVEKNTIILREEKNNPVEGLLYTLSKQ